MGMMQQKMPGQLGGGPGGKADHKPGLPTSRPNSANTGPGTPQVGSRVSRKWPIPIAIEMTILCYTSVFILLTFAVCLNDQAQQLEYISQEICRQIMSYLLGAPAPTLSWVADKLHTFHEAFFSSDMQILGGPNNIGVNASVSASVVVSDGFWDFSLTSESDWANSFSSGLVFVSW